MSAPFAAGLLNGGWEIGIVPRAITSVRRLPGLVKVGERRTKSVDCLAGELRRISDRG
jgi:hypothetical protein